ncbi:hypothetical protein HK100_010200, partial [Physocladia obscura]
DRVFDLRYPTRTLNHTPRRISIPSRTVSSHSRSRSRSHSPTTISSPHAKSFQLSPAPHRKSVLIIDPKDNKDLELEIEKIATKLGVVIETENLGPDFVTTPTTTSAATRNAYSAPVTVIPYSVYPEWWGHQEHQPSSPLYPRRQKVSKKNKKINNSTRESPPQSTSTRQQNQLKSNQSMPASLSLKRNKTDAVAQTTADHDDDLVAAILNQLVAAASKLQQNKNSSESQSRSRSESKNDRNNRNFHHSNNDDSSNEYSSDSSRSSSVSNSWQEELHEKHRGRSQNKFNNSSSRALANQQKRQQNTPESVLKAQVANKATLTDTIDKQPQPRNSGSGDSSDSEYSEYGLRRNDGDSEDDNSGRVDAAVERLYRIMKRQEKQKSKKFSQSLSSESLRSSSSSSSSSSSPILLPASPLHPPLATLMNDDTDLQQQQQASANLWIRTEDPVITNWK